MSYDLTVFDPAAPPPGHAGFLAWFKEQTKWHEGHRYDDPKVSTGGLRDWFLEMIQTFPTINGPYATKDFDNPKSTDYSVGRTMIYAAFAWSQVKEAHNAVFNAAIKHRVGFYDNSADDGQIWKPKLDGNYIRVFGTGNSLEKLGKTQVHIVGFGIKKEAP